MKVKERLTKYLNAYKDIYNRDPNNKDNLIDVVELLSTNYRIEKSNTFTYSITIKINDIVIWKKTYFSLVKSDEVETKLLEKILLEICVYGLNAAYGRIINKNYG